MHLVGRAAVELEVARHRERVGAGLLHRLADVERLDPREIVGARLRSSSAELHQQAAALGRGEPSPVAGERPLGRVDRGVDVGRVARARSRRS